MKPCRCGSTEINVLHVSFGPGWACLIGCLNADCDLTLIRYGLTKKHAEWRAIRAWNQEVGKCL